ncbi:winged helix-turn-helix domain-containing protein [Acinetobacter cumulans]|uniref:Winged helix-turn-helix domain-containing protein n=1 Tax=Acinetobacter cumulans TaxID=2136182 RepID=A0A498CRP8_9GAMM|nr:winged helix-turn-helix domain-containing protein [Acinetobacter cumulans]RLL29048.1 winged helix-turn-helix domain-containing protein [Acinetobacter cumulans]
MKDKTEVNRIAVFERVIAVLQAIQTTPVASTSELREQVLPDLSLRSAQRYLKGLERAGYVSQKLDAGWHRGDARYFLTEKAKQLFGVQG